jgi:hypothetical protein
MKRLVSIAAAVLLFSLPANAASILVQPFSTENGGVGALDFTEFASAASSGRAGDLTGTGFNVFASDAGVIAGGGLVLSAGQFVLPFGLAVPQPGRSESRLATVFGVLSASYGGLNVSTEDGSTFAAVNVPFTLGAGDRPLISFEPTVAAIPEPVTGLLLATGLFAAWRRCARRP